ncbi:sigma-70 family RNA polymerase sigma factor [Solirubrobacter phytolaccae]|uniref:Sigma-70 family RNA polymerase sigma factor n=1 Tax=Solirubrobacter phytolaccae TaxID=1404360 RepID=A0A9X3SJL7_9ACTN|nr:sigma-70 family RNA polymerase sigma factor [Solirubrobacter phytolaccae]MDA0185387.1 sigma-70 family RNA polymerase sigma factor [Solirubrobacter phytolaccae]
MGETGDLVERARDGDREAWNELVDRFARMVLSIAASNGVRPADRDDVTQVTWLKLAQNLDRIEHPDAVGAWLAITCRNEALRVRARSAREVPVEGEHFNHVADDVDVEDEALRSVPDESVSTAFAKLSERCQTLLRLLLLERPYTEISETLDMPVGAIGPTRSRCLGKLRQLLPKASGITGAPEDS